MNLGKCACGGYHASDTECLIEMSKQIKLMAAYVAELKQSLSAAHDIMERQFACIQDLENYIRANEKTDDTCHMA